MTHLFIFLDGSYFATHPITLLLKYWGDGCMGRPRLKFSGDRPPSPLSLRPWNRHASLFVYVPISSSFLHRSISLLFSLPVCPSFLVPSVSLFIVPPLVSSFHPLIITFLYTVIAFPGSFPYTPVLGHSVSYFQSLWDGLQLVHPGG